jgi:hypothetical protein
VPKVEAHFLKSLSFECDGIKIDHDQPGFLVICRAINGDTTVKYLSGDQAEDVTPKNS